MKTKYLGFASLAVALGVGALAGFSASGFKEARATTQSTAGTKITLVNESGDKSGKRFTANGVDAVLHMHTITFDNTAFANFSEFSATSMTSFESYPITIGDGYIDVDMVWVSGDEGQTRTYAVVIPWFISSFTANFRNTTNDWLFVRNNSDSFSATFSRGNDYTLYSWNDVDNDWWATYDGKNYRVRGVSGQDSPATGFTYSATTYALTLTASPAAGGTVTGAGTYLNYKKVQVTATPNSNYLFSNWSDDGAATHYVSMNSAKSLTATFVKDVAPLTAPTASVNGNVVSWNSISGADGYRVSVDGHTTNVASNVNSYTVTTNKPGNHAVKVMALGDGEEHLNSQYSNQVSVSVASAYYLVGGFNSWAVTGDSGEIKATTSNSVHTVSVTTTEADVEAKLVKFSASENIDVPNVTWYTPTNESSSFPYPVSKEGSNIRLGTAGTYTFTVSDCNDSDQNASYVVTPNSSMFNYTVKIGDGEPVNMVSVAKDGYKAQFKATIPSVTSGQSISFKNGSSALVATADTSESHNGDVYNHVILQSASNVEVYLKQSASDDSWSYYVSGRTAKFFVSVWPAFYAAVVNTAELDGKHYMYTGLELAKDAEFKLYCTDFFVPSGDKWGQGDGLGFTNDGIKVTATKAGIYNIYINNADSGTELYIGGQSAADIIATKFANDFLDAFQKDATHDGICVADGSTSESAVSNTWSSMKTNYDTNVKSNSDAVSILSNADSDLDNAYGHFAALYDTIFKKYGSKLSLNNFATRSVTSPAIVALLDTAKIDNSSFFLVIIIAGLSVTSLGLLAIKRKKRQR